STEQGGGLFSELRVWSATLTILRTSDSPQGRAWGMLSKHSESEAWVVFMGGFPVTQATGRPRLPSLQADAGTEAV
ncbi:hypothetical protein U0070_019552, partial [Myodes glareolus]